MGPAASAVPNEGTVRSLAVPPSWKRIVPVISLSPLKLYRVAFQKPNVTMPPGMRRIEQSIVTAPLPPDQPK